MLHTPSGRRWASLAVGTVLGIGVLATTQSSAHAVAETCQGVPATIVGSPSTTFLTGTKSADVIVSNGSPRVTALGGDDIICLTAATGAREQVSVSAGTGNDQVINLRNGSATKARVDLEAGDDVYTGSDGKDIVREIIDITNEVDPGAGSDQIRTGAGKDSVTSGQFQQPNTDIVDLGTGSDELELRSIDNRAATLIGGTGTDLIRKAYRLPWVAATDADGSWRFDNRTQTATLDGAPTIRWSSFEDFDLAALDDDDQLTFVGSAASETVTFSTWFTNVAMGGGRDTIIGRQFTGADNSLHRSRLSGGSGRDEFQFAPFDPFGLVATGDLKRGRLVVEDEGTFNDIRADLSGIEDLAFEGREVTVKGDNKANRLRVTGCDVTAVGRGWDDRIKRTGRDAFAGRNCRGRSKSSRLVGGSGNDHITGADLADTIIGGPGRDRAEGRMGRDTCRAEVERSCERN